MSHLLKTTTKDGKAAITNLDVLIAAARELGFEFQKKNTMRWYSDRSGTKVNPNLVGILHPGPEIASKAAAHGSFAYDIGIENHPSGTGFNLVYDSYDRYTSEVVGKNIMDRDGSTVVAPKLMRQYYVEAIKSAARESGDEVAFAHQPDGSIVATVVPTQARLAAHTY